MGTTGWMGTSSRLLRVVTAGVGLCAHVAVNAASTISGGSDLLDSTSTQQLSTWLGQGDIQLTNIFDKAPGQTSLDFHAAVDGKGATFSVMEVTGYSGVPFEKPVLVGGYNPQSWHSGNGYNYTELDSDRTGFIFNLNLGLLFRQQLGSFAGGLCQTFNAASFGPTFGCGHDLHVNESLNFGYSYLYSYGDGTQVQRDIARYPNSYAGNVQGLQYGQIEVFSIAHVSGVPEPQTYLLLLAGLAFMGLSRRHIRTRTPA